MSNKSKLISKMSSAERQICRSNISNMSRQTTNLSAYNNISENRSRNFLNYFFNSSLRFGIKKGGENLRQKV